jgi:hypothetical protein
MKHCQREERHRLQSACLRATYRPNSGLSFISFRLNLQRREFRSKRPPGFLGCFGVTTVAEARGGDACFAFWCSGTRLSGSVKPAANTFSSLRIHLGWKLAGSSPTSFCTAFQALRRIARTSSENAFRAR